MSSNNLSKNILQLLIDSPSKGLKFSEIARQVESDKRKLAQNLFYLEHNNFLELRGVYSSDSIFPEIYFVSLRPKGLAIARQPQILDAVFPSDMEHCIFNVDSVAKNILKSVKEWASDDARKIELYNSLKAVFESEAFAEFNRDIYGRHEER